MTGNEAVVMLTVTTVLVHVIEFVTGLFITIGATALGNTWTVDVALHPFKGLVAVNV